MGRIPFNRDEYKIIKSLSRQKSHSNLSPTVPAKAQFLGLPFFREREPHFTPPALSVVSTESTRFNISDPSKHHRMKATFRNVAHLKNNFYLENGAWNFYEAPDPPTLEAHHLA